MEIIEKPNMRAVHFLNSISYDEFTSQCLADAEQTGEKRPSQKDIKTWYSVMTNYVKSTLKTGGVITRIYKYSQNTPAGLGGRLFSSGSIQSIWGAYRGLLMNNIATDIDMANAHPVILRYVCGLHDIECPDLEYYIRHRDRCLSEFPSRAIGKNAYLVATNSDKYSRTSGLPTHYKKYEKEMKRLQKTIAELPEYQSLRDTIPEAKLQKNYYGCAINRVMCYYENIILQHAIHYVNSVGVEVAVLMFDGMLVYGNFYDKPDFLESLSAYVKTQMPDLNMEWTYKEHDTTSYPIPDEFDEKKYEAEVSVRVAANDADAGRMILKELEGVFVRDTTGRVFYKHNNVWCVEPDEIKTLVVSIILNFNIYKITSSGTQVSYSQNIKSANAIYDTMLHLIRDSPPVDIYSLFHTTTRGRIAFLNGVLDFTNKQFYEWPKVEFPYYTCCIVQYNYSPVEDKTVMDKITDTILKRLFGANLDKAMLFLSRAIAGYAMDKRWMTYVGSRDSGKSIIFKAMEEAFGCRYVKPFAISNLMYQRGRKQSQDNRGFYWALDFEFIRLAVSMEVPEPKDNMKLDGAVFKKLSSGCDTLVARRNYDRMDTYFTLDTTFAIFGNNSIESDVADIWQHALQVSSVHRYVPQTEINEMTASGVSPVVLSVLYPQDTTILHNITTPAWRLALIHLLLNAFSASPVSIENPYEDEEDVSLRQSILNYYEITLSDKDFIPISDVRDLLQSDKKKLHNELSSMGITKKKCYTTDSTHLNKYCYYGLRVKSQ